MPADLIVFGEDWGGLPSSTQHLINFLADDRKILWVNSIGLRQPHFNVSDFKRALKKLFSRTKALNSVIVLKHNINVINVKTLPAPQSTIARKIAALLIKMQLLPVIKKLQLKNYIVWTSLPTAVDVIGELGEKASVYYCGDDFSSLAGVDHKTVAQHEKILKHKADLIITASELLHTKLTNKNTRLLTHGVDYDLFTKPCKRASDLPNNLKPIAGFYGSISHWLNIDLLVDVIKQMPHWDFVFIGTAVINISALKAFDNVTFLGAKAHHLLPSYSQYWSVSLLPFKQNEQIKACNPLKLYEYLAAGQPIVSTPFPALANFHDLVNVVNSSKDMITALENTQTLCHKKSYKESTFALKHSVKNQTWHNKAQQVSQWMDKL